MMYQAGTHSLGAVLRGVDGCECVGHCRHFAVFEGYGAESRASGIDRIWISIGGIT
jgi:hypothetical protein